jgi:Tfp pilus assembly protein FimT
VGREPLIRKRAGFQRGATLLEILVVLGLMVALLVVLIPAFFRLLQGYRLQSTANIVATNLRFARAAALKQKVLYRLTFRDSGEAPPNTYTIEYAPGSVCCQPVRNMDTNISDRVQIDPTSIDVVDFDSRGAATITGGSTSSILLTSESVGSYTITVSSTGAINTIRNSN